MVTRVDRKRILEIDGRRAYDVFAEESTSGTVDEDPWARDLATQSIALKFDGADVVRSILGSDKEHGYIDVAGDIEEGCQIQFMETSVDDLLDGVDEAAHGLRMKTVGLTEKSLCVIIGCMGRLSILGEQSTQEMQRLHAAIGDNICQVGMYSLGEILTTSSSYPQVHNLTMNVAVIREH